MARRIAATAAAALTLLASPSQARAQVDTAVHPPANLLGRFRDDYGGRFVVTPTAFHQGSHSVYHIVAWYPAQRYFIAQNDSANRTDGGKWTRIDWVELTGMAPWQWAFCFSAYDAATRDAAEKTSVAKPETPKTGCNGFPYSRMRADSGESR